MSEKYIGIDLGSEFLKIAVHENNRICGEISERIPEQLRMDGKILSLESAAEFLKETGRKHGLSRYGACVVLPEKQVITKRVRMAGMDPKHLILNLPYEFYDYLEHSVEEWVYDYSLADSIPDGTGQDESMDLLAAAVPVRVVEWYQKLIRMVGWKLSAMAPASSAISNLIMSDQGKQDGRRSNCCVMDCGRQGVRLYFYQKGLLFAKRGLEFCDTEERLLFELEKIWDYYQTCYPGYIPELIYVTGGKRNPLLEAAITEELEAECCDWTKLLDNSQEPVRGLISAEAAGMTFWKG